MNDYSEEEYKIFSRLFILNEFSEENLKKLSNIKIGIVGIREFSEDNSLSFTRKLLSKLIIFLINRIFFVKKTNDPMSGFFILKKEIFLRSKNKLYNSGFKILFDIIFSYNNIKVLDYKINFGQRKFNKSKLNFKIILKIVVLIIFKLFQKKIN